MGIQSSYKSTLLNFMFNLRFAVAAERCTKGIYLSLLKIEDDYMIVLDTEGLRSPEINTNST